jgi:hypothetical protein
VNYWRICKLLVLGIAIVGVFCQSSCKKKNNNGPAEDTWDIETQGIPKFAGHYLELNKISRISRFRSSAGHDYSDFTEQCRSMKHYFYPKDTINWQNIQIFSPVSGTVTRFEQEWAGFKIEIQSDEYPAFRMMLFHVAPLREYFIGDKLFRGQQIGYHIGFETWSDVAVFVNDPTRQGRLVSYFETLTDNVFQDYQLKGIAARSDFIIYRVLRDLHPLQCNGDAFLPGDTLAVWVQLP